MAAPTVLAIDIASGPPGTMVVLTGTNFNDTVSAVSFGTFSAGSNFTVLDEVSILAYVPAGTGTSLNVTVTNSDGTGTLTSGWSYDSNEGGPGGGGGSAPTVTDLSIHTSANTDEQGGDSVTITGTKFTTAIYVWFGDTPATFSISSDTSIVAVAPPGTGTVDVDIQNAYGRSAEPGDPTANNFTYPLPAAPTISTVAPAAGTINTVVTITGDNFSTASVVYFDVYTAAFQIISDESIRAFAPEGPSAGTALTVSVVTRGGTATKATAFTYLAAIADLTATAGVGSVTLKWSPIASSSPVMYEVYGDDGVANPTTLRTTTTQTSVTFQQAHADDDWYYGVKVVDIFGNKSAMSNIVQITSTEVIADTIAAGAIDAMNLFASTIRPVGVVGSLPSLPDDTNYPDGSTIMLTTDNRLYRNLGGGPNTNSHADKATWYDLTANGYNGTLDGFAWTTSSGWAGDGTAANAYRLVFDGASDHVDLPSGVYSLPDDKTASLELWFRTTSTPATQYLLTLHNSSTYYCMIGMNVGQRILCNWKDSGGSAIISTNTGCQFTNDGSWHHVVVTIDSGSTTAKLYWDGNLLASNTSCVAGTWSGAAGWLGGRYDANYWFNGDIGCFRGYSDVLSATEVAQNCAAGPTGLGYVTDNLAAHYCAKRALKEHAWVPLVDVAEGSGPISGTQITGNSIVAGSIAAGAIGATEIASDAIMTRSLFIGSYENLVPNGNSELSYTGKDTGEASPDYEFRGVSVTYPYAGSQSRRVLGVASGTTTMAITRLIPVIPGEKYYCEARCRLTTATGHGHIKLCCFKSDGTTEVSTSPVRTDEVTVASYPADPIVVKDGSSNPWYTIPDGGGTPANAGAYIQVFMETTDAGASNYLYADEIFLRRMMAGNLIVDGSITADHISGNYLYGTEIEGGTITGGTVATSGSTSDERVVLSSGNKANITFPVGHTLDADPYIGSLHTGSTTSLSLFMHSGKIEADDTAATIELNSLTTGVSKITLFASEVAVSDDLTVGTDAVVSGMVKGTTIVPVNYSSGVDNGVFIQDASTTSNKVKIYFDSGTNKCLWFRLDGDTYGTLDLTALNAHVPAAWTCTTGW